MCERNHEQIIDRYFSTLPPELRDVHHRLDLSKFEIPELAGALKSAKDEINTRWGAQLGRIKTPSGVVVLHFDYIESDDVNAIVFYHEGVYFVCVTSKMLVHLIKISGIAWRLNALNELLGIDSSHEVRDFLFQAVLLIQLQVLSSHELGHLFHGHVDPGTLTEEFAASADPASQISEHLRDQATEVEADGYAVHMLLDNLLTGDSGISIHSKLRSTLPKEDCILSLYMFSAAALFFFLRPQAFVESSVRMPKHPFALARINLMLQNLIDWCKLNRPGLEKWASLEKFQWIMACVQQAASSPQQQQVWTLQGEFLKSPEGSEYLDDLHAEQVQLRADMAQRSWKLINGIRCLVCGSSKQEGGKWAGSAKCAKCGAAMGLRSERCWVSDETINKLLPHAKTLEDYGFQFTSDNRLEKNWAETVGGVAALMYIVNEVRPGTVQEVVQILKKVHIPYDEIIRLRLDEPEVVKDLYEKDDAH